MKANFIVRSLIGAFVNSPPSRLKEIPLSAFSGVTTAELTNLRDKLLVVSLLVDNNLTIRENAVKQAMETIPEKDVFTRRTVLQEIDKGRLLK